MNTLLLACIPTIIWISDYNTVRARLDEEWMTGGSPVAMTEIYEDHCVIYSFYGRTEDFNHEFNHCINGKYHE